MSYEMIDFLYSFLSFRFSRPEQNAHNKLNDMPHLCSHKQREREKKVTEKRKTNNKRILNSAIVQTKCLELFCGHRMFCCVCNVRLLMNCLYTNRVSTVIC